MRRPDSTKALGAATDIAGARRARPLCQTHLLELLGPSDPSTFSASVAPESGRVVVRLAGELDLSTVPEAEAAVARARQTHPGPLRLDLAELTFADSSGLRLILQIDVACRAEGCALDIVPGPRSVQRVFELAGVESILPFTPPSR